MNFNLVFQGYCPLGKGLILDEPKITEIAKRHNKSPAQVLIRWNIQQKVVCIPKSTKEHRVKENSEVGVAERACECEFTSSDL